MNTTTVVQDAVAALNQQKHDEAVQASVRLINQIQDKQSRIDECNKRVVDLRVDLDKLAKTVVDETTVFGASLPTNANKATITEVIAKANKDRQASVEATANKLTTAITSEQDSVVMLEKAIAELREKLAKIEQPVVTVAQVTGS